MAKSISLRTVDTHHVFATSSVSLSDRWDWIRNAICESYDWFNRDDLELVETDDGDIVTHRGEPIVEIHNCYLTNAARPLVPFREVA